MKTPIYLATFCLSALSLASAEPTSPAEALSDALFTESVSRDVESAAAKYVDLLKKFPESKKQAVVALLRLAEIRTSQGRNEEAGLLFKQILKEHSLSKAQTKLVGKRLGEDVEESEPRAISQIEDERSLNDKVYRNLWKLKVTPGRRQIVKKTFTVKVDERLVEKKFPKGFTVETISHSPGQEVSEFVSQFIVRDGFPTEDADPIPTFYIVSAIGQSYTPPAGFLEVGSMEGFPMDPGPISMSLKRILFSDKVNHPHCLIEVTVKLECLTHFEVSNYPQYKGIMPDLGDTAWTVTIPPIPALLEKAHYSE